MDLDKLLKTMDEHGISVTMFKKADEEPDSLLVFQTDCTGSEELSEFSGILHRHLPDDVDIIVTNFRFEVDVIEKPHVDSVIVLTAPSSTDQRSMEELKLKFQDSFPDRKVISADGGLGFAVENMSDAQLVALRDKIDACLSPVPRPVVAQVLESIEALNNLIEKGALDPAAFPDALLHNFARLLLTEEENAHIILPALSAARAQCVPRGF